MCLLSRYVIGEPPYGAMDEHHIASFSRFNWAAVCESGKMTQCVSANQKIRKKTQK